MTQLTSLSTVGGEITEGQRVKLFAWNSADSLLSQLCSAETNWTFSSLLWGTSQPPNPTLGTPEPDPPVWCPTFSLLSGWSRELLGAGSAVSTLLPSFFLETCFNRESMQCIQLCYNPPLYCIWGIRDWTSGGSHTFPIRRREGERESERERGSEREGKRERERLPFHSSQWDGRYTKIFIVVQEHKVEWVCVNFQVKLQTNLR